MSKKHKKNSEIHHTNTSNSQKAESMHAQEYKVIRADLSRVLVLNVFYLAILLVIYYTNSQSHYLEKYFDKIFHF